MNELLELALKAHGGLDRWDQFEKAAVDMTLSGVLWGFFGHENNPIAKTTFESRLRQQHVDLSEHPLSVHTARIWDKRD